MASHDPDVRRTGRRRRRLDDVGRRLVLRVGLLLGFVVLVRGGRRSARFLDDHDAPRTTSEGKNDHEHGELHGGAL
jgi:hypothetical protein